VYADNESEIGQYNSNNGEHDDTIKRQVRQWCQKRMKNANGNWLMIQPSAVAATTTTTEIPAASSSSSRAPPRFFRVQRKVDADIHSVDIGLVYDDEAGSFDCDCKDFQFRSKPIGSSNNSSKFRGPCKHILAVLLHVLNWSPKAIKNFLCCH